MIYMFMFIYIYICTDTYINTYLRTYISATPSCIYRFRLFCKNPSDTHVRDERRNLDSEASCVPDVRNVHDRQRLKHTMRVGASHLTPSYYIRPRPGFRTGIEFSAHPCFAGSPPFSSLGHLRRNSSTQCVFSVTRRCLTSCESRRPCGSAPCPRDLGSVVPHEGGSHMASWPHDHVDRTFPASSAQ